MPELAEQIRELIDNGAPTIAAREAIDAASRNRSVKRVWVLRRSRTYALGGLAMAAAIAVLIVFLVVFRSSNGPSGAPPIHNVQSGGRFVAYLVPGAPASESELKDASAVMTRRLSEAGLRNARAAVSGEELIVTTSGDPRQVRSVLSRLLDPGVLLFRPVLCAAPPYSPADISSRIPPLPTACPRANQLNAGNLNVNVLGGNPQNSVSPWFDLVHHPTTAAHNDSPEATVLLPVAPNAGFQSQRLLAGPTAVDNSGILSVAPEHLNGAGWLVEVTFTDSGGAVWNALALRQFHAYVAVDYDGSILSAPLIEPGVSTFSSFAAKTEISAGFSEASANDLAWSVESGPLPVLLSLVVGTKS